MHNVTRQCEKFSCLNWLSCVHISPLWNIRKQRVTVLKLDLKISFDTELENNFEEGKSPLMFIDLNLHMFFFFLFYYSSYSIEIIVM